MVYKIITQQYKLPVIVGGTGFYLDSLLDGINSDEIPVDQILRNSLENQSIFVLQEKLKKIDEEYYYNLNNSERNNPRRLIRKIEILEYLNKHPQPKDKKEGLSKNHQILKIGLTADKKILDKRIEKRVVKRIEQGMLEETKKLITEGLTYERMRELGLEYSVMADFFEGVISTKDEFVFILQQKIKQYAKRQMTWFKRDKQIFWIDINEKNYVAKVEKLVQDWYNT